MTSSGSVLNSGCCVPASLFYAYIIAPNDRNVKHFLIEFSDWYREDYRFFPLDFS